MLDAQGFEHRVKGPNGVGHAGFQGVVGVHQQRGAQIDLFGVGERMITASSQPVFGGVYKLVAVEDGAPDFRVL